MAEWSGPAVIYFDSFWLLELMGIAMNTWKKKYMENKIVMTLK